MDFPPHRRSFPRLSNLPPGQYGVSLRGPHATGERELLDISEHGLAFRGLPGEEFAPGTRISALVTLNGEASELTLIVAHSKPEAPDRSVVGARFAYEEGFDDFLDANTEQLAVVRDVLEDALEAIARKS